MGNVELMHECCPQQSRMQTARVKLDKQTEAMLGRVNMATSKRGTKQEPKS